MSAQEQSGDWAGGLIGLAIVLGAAIGFVQFGGIPEAAFGSFVGFIMACLFVAIVRMAKVLVILAALVAFWAVAFLGGLEWVRTILQS